MTYATGPIASLALMTAALRACSDGLSDRPHASHGGGGLSDSATCDPSTRPSDTEPVCTSHASFVGTTWSCVDGVWLATKDTADCDFRPRPPPGDGDGGGICGSPFVMHDDAFDGCLSFNCCDTFDPCIADGDCAACLQSGPTGVGCDTDPLFLAFQGCFATTCPIAICGTDLGTSSPSLNACLANNCCEAFNACELEPACLACLQAPEGPGCDAVHLVADYNACRDAACPQNVCGATPILYTHTYDNGSMDTNYARNACAESCCTELALCADPSMDGYLEGADPEAEACRDCLVGDAACPGSALQMAAAAYESCVAQACP